MVVRERSDKELTGEQMKSTDTIKKIKIYEKRTKYKIIRLFEQEMELKKKQDNYVRNSNYLNEKRISKKIFADGTTTLFRNEFKYTTKTKKIKCFIGKEVFKNVIWRSKLLDPIKYCNCEAIKLQ